MSIQRIQDFGKSTGKKDQGNFEFLQQKTKKEKESEKSQHGCVRWALCEHPTPPCSDFDCGGLEDHHHINK